MKIYILAALLTVPIYSANAGDNPALDAMQEYLDFADYADGAISSEQLASIDSQDIFFVDTRDGEQYDAGHIPGAVNIEWRQILSRRDEIPTDKPVVLYCETGLLSSRAHFALRIAGRENVKVLSGGYSTWSAR